MASLAPDGGSALHTPPLADLPWASRAFGLSFRSSIPVPGLPARSDAGGEERCDVAVRMGSLPPWFSPTSCTAAERWYRSGDADSDEVAGLVVWRMDEGRWLRFRFVDGTEFVLDAAGSEVWASWPEALSVEDTATYLLGPIAGFLLRLRSTTSLHASVVDVDGAAVALAGAPGAGKSTTAAAFALAGHGVLTDDLAPLDEHDGGFRVRPAYPRVRLWPDSAEFLFGTADALPLLTPTWEKRYLQLGEGANVFADAPLPLAALYLLGPRGGYVDAPRIGAPRPADAFVELTAHLYTSPALRPETRLADFQLVRRLIAAVPVRRTAAGSDPARLPELVAAIVRDVRTLRATQG